MQSYYPSQVVENSSHGLSKNQSQVPTTVYVCTLYMFILCCMALVYFVLTLSPPYGVASLSISVCYSTHHTESKDVVHCHSLVYGYVDGVIGYTSIVLL